MQLYNILQQLELKISYLMMKSGRDDDKLICRNWAKPDESEMLRSCVWEKSI